MRSLLAGALASAVLIGTASAAPTTIGSFTFDDSNFADTSSVAAGTVTNVGNIVGGNLDTFAGFFGGSDVIQFGFTDNNLVNGAGIDLLVFEGFSAEENQNLSLSLGGMSIIGAELERIPSNTLPGVNQQTTIFGFDLSDLGIAFGAAVVGDLFLSPANNTPNISAIAALNTVVDPSEVPLPASFPLLLAGLSALRLASRRKSEAK